MYFNAAACKPRVDLQLDNPEYQKLRRSIEEFGCVEPNVWNDRTGNMVGGHKRFKILGNEQGRTEVEVSVVHRTRPGAAVESKIQASPSRPG
ncbi:hypothetical protein J27TS7_26210 [Paenibacillus dendritiformis]|nr:hypothetical protein J27TS7_26210 [Paenibacillus dendritiformis]